MGPGSVFQAELLILARRPRYFAMRAGYVLVLLLFISLNHPAFSGADWYPRGEEISIQEMSRIGSALVTSFSWTQSLALLLLTPGLVAGVIADERQRRTLDDLLGSCLSSAEIVLGKVCARLLQIGLLLGLGLPVLSLLSLFGGVDPAEIAWLFAATVSGAVFLLSLSVVVSVYARTPREAVTQVYMLELGWLLLPPLFRFAIPVPTGYWGRVSEALAAANGWVSASSPLSVLIESGRSPTSDRQALLWMVATQLAASLVFLATAVVRLRPRSRHMGGGRGGVRSWWGCRKVGRLLPRPACGDRPMLWKERYVGRSGLGVRLVSSLLFLVFAMYLTSLVLMAAEPAYRELQTHGYFSGSDRGARSGLNMNLRFIQTALFVCMLIGVASAASQGVTGEREGDTWVSLLATPLTAEDVVHGKVLGALCSVRALAVLFLGFAATGLALGAIHPLGFLANLLTTAVYLTFAAALGVSRSLRARNSTRALLSTLAILIVLNGAYLILLVPLRNNINQTVIYASIMPFFSALSVLSFEDVRQLMAGPWTHRSYSGPRELLAAGGVSVLAYCAATAFFLYRSVSRFDDLHDRPRV